MGRIKRHNHHDGKSNFRNQQKNRTEPLTVLHREWGMGNRDKSQQVALESTDTTYARQRWTLVVVIAGAGMTMVMMPMMLCRHEDDNNNDDDNRCATRPTVCVEY